MRARGGKGVGVSYDVEVAAVERPDEATFRDLVSGEPGVELTGTLQGEGNLIVYEHVAEGSRPLLMIEVQEAGSGVVSDELADAAPGASWLTLLSVPAVDEALGVHSARRLAFALVERYGGGAYDPQEERILTSVQRQKRPAAERRVDVLTISWFFPLATRSPEAADPFLDLATELLPEALPVRHKGYRKGSDVSDGFRRMWSSPPDSPYYRTVEWEWETRRPVFGAYGQAVVRTPGSEHDGVPSWDVSVDISAEDVRRSPTLRERVVAFFCSLADELHAFYGAAFVSRNVLYRRSLWYDDLSESLSIRAWYGLPRFLTWLTWFGREYLLTLEDVLSPLRRRCDIRLYEALSL